MSTPAVIVPVEKTAEKPLSYHQTVFESLPSFNSYHKYELPAQNLLPPEWNNINELLEQISQLLFALRYRVEDFVNLSQEALRAVNTPESIWAFFHEVVLPLPHTINPPDIEDARIDLFEKMHEAHLKNRDVNVYELVNPGAEAQEPIEMVNDDDEIMMDIAAFHRPNGNEFQSDRDFTLRQNRISDSDLTEYTIEFIPDEMPVAPGLDDQSVADGASEENEDAPEPPKAAPKKKAAAKKGKGKAKVVDNEAADSDDNEDAPEPPKAAPKKKAPAKKAPAKKAKGKAKAVDGEATEVAPAPAKTSTAGKKKASAPAEVLPTTRVTRASSRIAGISAPELPAPPPAPRPRRGRPPVAAEVPPQAGPSNAPPAIARKSQRTTHKPVDAPDARRLGKKRERPADDEADGDDSPVQKKKVRLTIDDLPNAHRAISPGRIISLRPEQILNPRPNRPPPPGTRVRIVNGIRFVKANTPPRQ
ncbi:hypothetical protein DFH06DRAFT_1470034 [Mycena polygramma]|nr:hypothetical protein DFH06DRAFT_1470034 [Mycena polygramma]